MREDSEPIEVKQLPPGFAKGAEPDYVVKPRRKGKKAD